MARRIKSTARRAKSASRKTKSRFYEQTLALGALAIILASVLYMGEILKPAQVAPVQTYQQYASAGEGAGSSGTVSVDVTKVSVPPQPSHSSASVMLVIAK